MWTVSPPVFHNNDYRHCLALIMKVYEVYGTSLQRVIQWEQVRRNCAHLATDLHPLLLFGSTTGVPTSMTLIGMAGKIRCPAHTDVGIIVFRGTQEWHEWFSNVDVLAQVDLTSPNAHKLVDVPKNVLSTSRDKHHPLLVSRGMYELYTLPSGRAVVNDALGKCFCSGPCTPSTMATVIFKRPASTCSLVAPSRTSKIDTDCHPKHKRLLNVPCGPRVSTSTSLQTRGAKKFDPMGPSLQDALMEQVRRLESECGVRRWIVCGHSLGGALATLVSFHLACTGRRIQATYSVASPRLGDPAFAQAYNRRIPHHYRVANVDDPVPSLPLALVPGQKACYAHVGDTTHVFSDLSMALQLCRQHGKKRSASTSVQMHDCALYAQYRYAPLKPRPTIQ